jgi:hypothetical protein
MIIVAPPNQANFEIADTNPIFSWEGHSSKATFTSTPYGVTIEFKLDIVGPDWLFVTLAEGEEGLKLTVLRTDSSGHAVTPIDSRCYRDYAEFLDDADYSPMVSALLRRYGQNPLLPEVECLGTIFFDMDPPSNPDIDHQCEVLIGKLNDRNWHVRRDAIKQLSKSPLAQHALVLSRRLELTAQQHACLETIESQYRLDLDPSLLAPLVAVVSRPDNIASASEP